MFVFVSNKFRASGKCTLKLMLLIPDNVGTNYWFNCAHLWMFLMPGIPTVIGLEGISVPEKRQNRRGMIYRTSVATGTQAVYNHI